MYLSKNLTNMLNQLDQSSYVVVAMSGVQAKATKEPPPVFSQFSRQGNINNALMWSQKPLTLYFSAYRTLAMCKPCGEILVPALCSHSLGVEPVDKDVMARPPRKARDKMITMPLLAQIFGSAFIIVAGTLWVFRKEVCCLPCSHILRLMVHVSLSR